MANEEIEAKTSSSIAGLLFLAAIVGIGFLLQDTTYSETRDFINDLKKEGVGCQGVKIDEPEEGSSLQDFGRCRTKKGDVHIFVWESSDDPIQYSDERMRSVYGGRYLVEDGNWVLVAAQRSLAEDVKEAVGGEVHRVAMPPPELPDAPASPAFIPPADIAGDLDCDQIGHPVVINGADPHGLDADNDGIGCES